MGTQGTQTAVQPQVESCEIRLGKVHGKVHVAWSDTENNGVVFGLSNHAYKKAQDTVLDHDIHGAKIILVLEGLCKLNVLHADSLKVLKGDQEAEQKRG